MTHAADRITINDVRAAGHCVRGAREWFDRHGLDFRDFIKHGISEADFLASGDGLAERIARFKRERTAWESQNQR